MTKRLQIKKTQATKTFNTLLDLFWPKQSVEFC